MSWITSITPGQADGLHFKVLPPAPQLRAWVRYYWVLKDHAASPQIDEYLAPDGFEEIIFSYADGFRREEVCGTDKHTHVVRGSYIVGLKSAGVSCSRTGRLAMIGVKLWPQVLHSLLRMPLHTLAGRPLPLDAINVPVLRELESRLSDAGSEHAIKSVLDRTLSHAITGEFNEMLSFSVRQLFESHGDIGIDALISRCGVHYRTLEKAFKERVGLPPKTLAKVLRFKHAFKSLSGKAEAGRLSALECGYYDQSHFCREFKFFTGTTPTRFFRERLSIDVAQFCLNLDLHTLNGAPSTAEFVL